MSQSHRWCVHNRLTLAVCSTGIVATAVAIAMGADMQPLIADTVAVTPVLVADTAAVMPVLVVGTVVVTPATDVDMAAVAVTAVDTVAATIAVAVKFLRPRSFRNKFLLTTFPALLLIPPRTHQHLRKQPKMPLPRQPRQRLSAGFLSVAKLS